MSSHTKSELEDMLEDVVNVLDLSECEIERHGPLGTSPAELVQLVLDHKNATIRNLHMHRIRTRRGGGGMSSNKELRIFAAVHRALKEMDCCQHDSIPDIFNEQFDIWNTGLVMDHEYKIREKEK